MIAGQSCGLRYEPLHYDTHIALLEWVGKGICQW